MWIIFTIPNGSVTYWWSSWKTLKPSVVEKIFFHHTSPWKYSKFLNLTVGRVCEYWETRWTWLWFFLFPAQKGQTQVVNFQVSLSNVSQQPGALSCTLLQAKLPLLTNMSLSRFWFFLFLSPAIAARRAATSWNMSYYGAMPPPDFPHAGPDSDGWAPSDSHEGGSNYSSSCLKMS